MMTPWVLMLLQNSLWKQVCCILNSQKLLLKLIMYMTKLLTEMANCMTLIMGGEEITQISQSWMALQHSLTVQHQNI